MTDAQPPDDIDPIEFVRAIMRMSPEDAEKVREDAAKAMRREDLR